MQAMNSSDIQQPPHTHVASLESLEPVAPLILRPDGQGPILFVCDHASNAMPAIHGNLGLSADQRADHIAWDPGAAGLTRGLSVKAMPHAEQNAFQAQELAFRLP